MWRRERPWKTYPLPLSVWFEGEEDASGSYTVIPEEITGYDPSEGVKYLTISVTIHGKLYEFKREDRKSVV